jgi:uncharacterized membrane-anchored protein
MDVDLDFPPASPRSWCRHKGAVRIPKTFPLAQGHRMNRNILASWVFRAGCFFLTAGCLTLSSEITAQPRAARADQPAAAEPAAAEPAEAKPAEVNPAEAPPAEAKPTLTPDQQRARDLYQPIQWQTGAGDGKLGTVATIKIPEHFRLAAGPGAAAWMELCQNPPNPNLLGVLMPEDNSDWFITFTYSDTGHVPDDDHAKLDADAILNHIRQGSVSGNEERRKRGWSTIEILGWLRPPAYDPVTKHLTWAVNASSDGVGVCNYDMRLLGRTGVMQVTLVADPASTPELIPQANQLAAGCDFNSGSKYAEWHVGDKVAEYGLAGLITGGAAVAAAKTGLLSKLFVILAKGGKAIIIGVLALAAGIWKFITGFLGGKREST